MRRRVDVERLGRFVAEVEEASAETSVSEEELRQLLAAEAGRRAPTRSRWRPTTVAAASFGTVMSLGTMAIVWLRLGGAPPPVPFTFGDPPEPGRIAELVSVPEKSDRPVVIRFSEGSTVVLHPAARGRIARVGPTGAEVLVEAGRAHFEVVHRSSTDWLVRTGPVVVRVTGTKFDTDYEPGADRFSFDLQEGSVVLSGCGFGEGRILRAPQRLHRSCSESPRIPVALPDPPLIEGPGISPSSVAPGEAESHHHQTAGSSMGWMKLAKSGRYAEAYEIVKAEFGRICRSANAGEVWLLADVARLAGHAPEARRAYTALRARHRGASLSSDAAFALGRLASDVDDDPTIAERWFETYLRERPDGRLARPALGRILELRLAAGDEQGALRAAREYRRRFPNGPDAREAGDLIDRGLSAPPGSATSPRQDHP